MRKHIDKRSIIAFLVENHQGDIELPKLLSKKRTKVCFARAFDTIANNAQADKLLNVLYPVWREAHSPIIEMHYVLWFRYVAREATKSTIKDTALTRNDALRGMDVCYWHCW